MANNPKKRSRKSGLPPGALVHIGNQKLDMPKIYLIRFSEYELLEEYTDSIEYCAEAAKRFEGITWINIDGVHHIPLAEKVGELFGIHPLVLEDIMNTEQRPKMEEHDNFLFFSMKMLSLSGKNNELLVEQVSMLLGKDLVITFQESPGDVFEPVRNRIRHGKGRIRKQKADYLAYALIDALVDNYFVILEKVGEEIEDLERLILKQTNAEPIPRIHALKGHMLLVRRAAWPMRELVNNFEKSESVWLEASTRIFLRDVYDHTIQIIDSVEVSRELVSGLLDMHLSSLSNKTNKVMKLLTIISTIFIPLTFIAGVYGMNFDYMPELRWEWGYPAILALMFLAAITMLWFFRRKKWL